MNILVAGGTGFVGNPLVKSLLSRGDSVTVLTRSIEKAQTIFPEKTPQFLTALSTLKDLNEFDAVINLAGEPIFDKRWTIQQKEKLRHLSLIHILFSWRIRNPIFCLAKK